MRRLTRARAAAGGVLAAGALAVSMLSGAAGAQATNGTLPGGKGYVVEVAVHFHGDVKGGAGVHTVPIPVSCWWAPAPGPYTDAVAMLGWYKAVSFGLDPRIATSQYGPLEIWQAAADAAAHGMPTSWYVATCLDPADYATWNGGSQESIEPGHGPQTWVTWRFRSFPAAIGVPPPRIDPADLAEAARRMLLIPAPAVDRNPKIDTVGAGEPTLIGLPTWFWVLDPAAVGGATGTRTVRAQVANVWAQVVATTGGLSLSSPAGGTACSPAQARTVYAPGVPESSACTVQFDHASVAPPYYYTVRASTAWTASWTGSGGTSGTLQPLQQTAVAQVPVAEVQTVVTP